MEVYDLNPLVSPNAPKYWEQLGRGLAHDTTHPVQFGEQIIALPALKQHGFSYWVGNMTPAVAATLLSGGAAATARAADGVVAADGLIDGAALVNEMPKVTRGMTLYRYHGWNEEPGGGLRLVEGAATPEGASTPSGSGAWGHSWTTVDPTEFDDPRSFLGLPTGADGNPARFLSIGVLQDPSGVRVRWALPLDGNPGGGPELLIPDPARQINLKAVKGVNPSP